MKIMMPVMLVAAMVTVAACSDRDKTHMERSYNLVDNDDKQAGTVKLHGVGGGEIVDNEGKVVGRIVPTDNAND